LNNLFENILESFEDSFKGVSELGSCMLAAERLTRKYLSKGFLAFDVIEGYVNFNNIEDQDIPHTWIEKDDGEIVDPTKDQFTRWGFNPEDIKYTRILNRYSPKEYLSLCKKYPVNESFEDIFQPSTLDEFLENFLEGESDWDDADNYLIYPSFKENPDFSQKVSNLLGDDLIRISLSRRNHPFDKELRNILNQNKSDEILSKGRGRPGGNRVYTSTTVDGIPAMTYQGEWIVVIYIRPEDKEQFIQILKQKLKT